MRTMRGVTGVVIGMVLAGLWGCGSAPGVLDGGTGSGGGDAGPAPDVPISGTGGAGLIPGSGGAPLGVGGSGVGGMTDATGGATGTGGSDTGGAGGIGVGGTTGSGGSAGAPDTGVGGAGGSGGSSVGGAGGAIPPLPAGSPLPLCTTVRDCVPGSRCIPALGLTTNLLSEGHCIPDGTGAGQCRAASPRCDAGFGCDPNLTNICLPAVGAGDSCNASRVCPDGTRCVGDLSGNSRCIPDGVIGGLCRSASPRCDAGLGCLGALCAPLSADGSCDINSTPCPDGSSCINGQCTAIGAAGGDCRSTSPTCDSGLVCQTVFAQTVVQRCGPGVGEGESCTGSLPCLDGLFCEFASGLCQRAGDVGSTCFSGVPCRTGLSCDFSTGLCSRGGTLNTSCRAGAICDDGLICDQANVCRPAASVSPDGGPCNFGFCQNGAFCTFSGGLLGPICVRVGAAPPPCGDGCAPGLVCDTTAAHCTAPLPVGTACNSQICEPGSGCAPGPGGGAARCGLIGALGGPCRPEAAGVAACDPGMICQSAPGISITPAISASSCQPATIGPGEACLVAPTPDNNCAPPAACISSVCVLPGQFGGACRRHDAAGSCDPLLGCLAGRCVSGLGQGAACDRASTTSVCANPYVCAGLDGKSTCQPRGYDQTVVAADFFDACASGLHVTLLPQGTFSSRDNIPSSMPIVIPFPFELWGVSYPQVVPSVNGVLLFAGAATAAQGGTAIGNGYLPSDQFGPAIAAFWDDLRLGDPPGSDICYQLVGAAPERRLVVQWKGAHRLSRAAVDLDFEVVLRESNVVELAYRTLSPTSGEDAPWADGSRAAIGLQSGYSGRAVVHAGAVAPGVALRFTPR